MGDRWLAACVVLAVLAADVCAEEKPGEDRWSRLATAERRQGDWVPLTCANCRPVHDQGVQASDSLPSVLTPPPRVEEARLLPPPPPDGLLQQAATGFLQSYTQEQPPPRKQQQYLQETSSQTVSRPQAQFLKTNGPISPNTQHFLQDPVGEFRPPQRPNNPQLTRQPQILQYDNQQFGQQFQDNGPYLNQPLFVGPQFLSSPFFPQGAIPPQNIQPISPVQVQPQTPISPNSLPVNKQNFPILGDRPIFEQQITTAGHLTQGLPQKNIQQAPELQEQYSANETTRQNENADGEEVQLLYVPVETLNQRGRNVGKGKSLPAGQTNQNIQDTGKGRLQNSNQNYEVPSRRPYLEDQANFNTESQQSKQQFNVKQISENLHHQLPPEDQERFNTQTHSVRQQFNAQQENDKFQRAENSGRFQADAQIIKQQYNIKQNVQFQQPIDPNEGQVNSQFEIKQNSQIHQQPQEVLREPIAQQFNGKLEDTFNNQYQQHFPQNIPNIQQFNHQGNRQGHFQQLPQTKPNNFNEQQIDNYNGQSDAVINHQSTQQQINQVYKSQKQQPYVNQPIEFDQTVNTEQPLIRNQVPIEQTSQLEFSNVKDQNSASVTQTQVPDVYTTYQTKRERLRNNHQGAIRNIQQQNSQFTRQFPEDYQQSPFISSTLAPVQNIETVSYENNQQDLRQQLLRNQKLENQQNKFEQTNKFQTDKPHLSTSLPLVSSTTPLPQTTPAPNQPPLSVYMETTEDNKVNDVLRLLKNAKTIQVLDTVGPDSPQVFVGPSNLKPPSGYIKFELPYLNTLESNRVERKVDKLPFFVAPLNFNPPPGYSKILFPPPHIGSVVVSNVTVLKTALHEKPYEHEPDTISSSERYLDQFTLPAQIQPISPQLPSLINSLQDEVYSASSTPTIPSTTTEITTQTSYTTPTYRGRGSNRGSQRGSSNYQTSSTPSRRQHTRTRRPYDGRPYSRRQSTTVPTTSAEPSTEAPVKQIPHQSEEQVYDNEGFNIQNGQIQNQPHILNSQQQFSQTNAQNNVEHNTNHYNQNQFNLQQQLYDQSLENENTHQLKAANTLQNTEQYNQNYEVTQNNHALEAVAHTTPVPTVASPVIHQEEQTFNSQRSSGGRRDHTRQHQRFRGRQRLATTTTDSYEETALPVENHGNHKPTDYNLNYHQNTQQFRNNPHRLVENVHFESATPENKVNIQTERADVGFQTTERQQPSQQENRFVQAVNTNLFSSPENIHNQLRQPLDTEPTVHNIQEQQNQRAHEQQVQSFTQLQNNRESASGQNPHSQYIPNDQQQIHTQEQVAQSHEPQHNTNRNIQSNHDQLLNQAQDYYEELAQQSQQVQDPIGQNQFKNQEQLKQFNQEVIQDNRNTNIHSYNPLQLDQTSFIQAEEHSTTKLSIQKEDEPQINQYNQQRLVQYNVPQIRPHVADAQADNEPITNTDNYQFQNQGNIEHHETTTPEAETTIASLVRLRGRVRSRQRGTKRTYQSTTTETPNYPTTYLSRQKPDVYKEDNQQDYNPRKRVNHNSRQTYTNRHNANKDVNSDQSNIGLNYEKPVTNDRVPQEADSVSTTTETITTVKPARRYQHILNRNKMRRTRPTNSPSSPGSSGTTKFILPTTPAPVTRLSSVRGRIRKPVSTTTTTTEYPQENQNWNEKEHFAPSAGSNEIFEPLYQTRDQNQASFGFQRNSAGSVLLQKTSPKPHVASSNDDEYWNQAVTIQQSTSFDFKPDASAVTPPSFQGKNDQFQGTFSPIWNGQIELQDGNYYDVFNQKHVGKTDDQTPFSSDQQKVVYKEIKRRPTGKENQYNEKDYEGNVPILKPDHESIPNEKKYPVYREIIKPAESIQEETSQVITDPSAGEIKSVHEKDTIEPSEEKDKNKKTEEGTDIESETINKEDSTKKKPSETTLGKKGRRRGSWVRVRVRKPQDMFETAESQNLASLSENSIPAVTKATNEKLAWTSEPSTEVPSTTTQESPKEPAETINFEEALKDMLKEFITNPEADKEETETAFITDVTPTDPTNTTIATTEEQNAINSDVNTEGINIVKEPLQDEASNVDSDGTIKPDEPVKTFLPDTTTEEVYTQEAVTTIPKIDDAETTEDPEAKTPSEQIYKSQHSRVLGTSTTTEISLETEICYRGRCVKTKKAETDGDLLPAE